MGDGDDLGAGIGQRLALPVSELRFDGESGVGEVGGEGVEVEEAEGASASFGVVPVGAGEGVGEGDEVAGNGGFDLGLHSHRGAAMDDFPCVLGRPVVPGAGEGISGLEGEAAALGEGAADGGEGLSQLVVVEEDLKGVAGHGDEVELVGPVDGGQVAVDPVDVGALAGLVEHGAGGVEPAEASAVAGVVGQVQQLTGAATDVEHRVGREQQGEVEVEVAAVGGEGVVELGEARVGEVGVGLGAH